MARASRTLGQPTTHGIQEHIAATKEYVESVGGGPPPQITSHQVRIRRMGARRRAVRKRSRTVTVAQWSNGAIAEYI